MNLFSFSTIKQRRWFFNDLDDLMIPLGNFFKSLLSYEGGETCVYILYLPSYKHSTALLLPHSTYSTIKQRRWFFHDHDVKMTHLSDFFKSLLSYEGGETCVFKLYLPSYKHSTTLSLPHSTYSTIKQCRWFFHDHDV